MNAFWWGVVTTLGLEVVIAIAVVAYMMSKAKV